eukprot:11300836-Alexandrium_andersonii.AAC.1
MAGLTPCLALAEDPVQVFRRAPSSEPVAARAANSTQATNDHEPGALAQQVKQGEPVRRVRRP